MLEALKKQKEAVHIENILVDKALVFYSYIRRKSNNKLLFQKAFKKE